MISVLVIVVQIYTWSWTITSEEMQFVEVLCKQKKMTSDLFIIIIFTFNNKCSG